MPFHARDTERSERSPISTKEPSSNRTTAVDPFAVRTSSHSGSHSPPESAACPRLIRYRASRPRSAPTREPHAVPEEARCQTQPRQLPQRRPQPRPSPSSMPSTSGPSTAGACFQRAKPSAILHREPVPRHDGTLHTRARDLQTAGRAPAPVVLPDIRNQRLKVIAASQRVSVQV